MLTTDIQLAENEHDKIIFLSIISAINIVMCLPIEIKRLPFGKLHYPLMTLWLNNSMWLVLVLSCSLLTNANAQQTKKVLIIGIDGCRPDALQQANTPNIDALQAQAVYSYYALNDDITYSGPGWSAMLTGVWSPKHGVTDNSFAGSDYENYPHFIQRVEEYDSDLYTVSISQWHPINNNILAGDADYTYNAINQMQVTSIARTQLTDEDPDVIFLHYDNVDHAGHSTGFSPSNGSYISSIESVDQQVRLVLNALEGRPTYPSEDWLILLSTDHGGQGNSHGGTSIEEETIFYIAHQKNLASHELRPDTLVVTDTTNCIGNEQHLVLEGGADQVAIPHIPLYDFGADLDFTVECRVKTSLAADVAILGNKDWNSGGNPGFVFSFRFANGPEWKINIGDGSNRVDVNTGGPVADNEWHHLAATFDRDGLVRMYEDGQLIDSASISSIGTIDTGAPFMIGADINGGYDYHGAIEEVRLWSGIVTQPALDDYKCTPVDAAHPHIGQLLGYWPLSEQQGAIANDVSTTANHGTITEPTWQSLATEVSYAHTPRITDIAVSALDHLCVDIDADWDLDGKSQLPDTATVIVLADSIPGSLRYVVNASCPDDVITFDESLNSQQILLDKGPLTLPHNLTIVGLPPHTEVSGVGQHSMLTIPTDVILTLESLQLVKPASSVPTIFNEGTIIVKDVNVQE